MSTLQSQAYAILMESDPLKKCEMGQALAKQWAAGELSTEDFSEVMKITHPGRPDKPTLVSPHAVARRSINSTVGRLALIHAIAHIEFNAINLAWDAVYRFRWLPHEYYADWISVALDETRHFQMLNQYLHQNGSEYGAFDAHNGLWEMAVKTDHDVLIRMALVPRVLEARGLDVTPDMIVKLNRAGDEEAVKHLNVILEEEINHVRIGSRWYHYFCDQRSMPRRETFISLVQEYMQGLPKGKLNLDARLLAGFERDELDYISGMVK